MTYGEIYDSIEAYQKIQLQKYKDTAIQNYQLANLIGLSVSRLLSEESEYPSIQKAYPGLFDDLVIEEKPEQQDWRMAKDILLEYANQHNKKRGGN